MAPAQPTPAPDVAALVDPSSSRAVAYELWGDGDPSLLDPDERAAVAGAVESRRGQFAAGRTCARRALVELGLGPAAIPVGPGRQPRWPAGVTGSISHTSSSTEAYAVAVAAPLASSTLGVDAEVVGRVTPSLYERLFVAAERDHLASLGAGGNAGAEAEAATAMFGIKESFYKAQFARTGAWVGFLDVEVRLDIDTPGAASLHRATDLAALDAFRWPGRAGFLRRGDLVVAAVAAEGHLTPDGSSSAGG